LNYYTGLSKPERDRLIDDVAEPGRVVCWACVESGSPKNFKFITAKHLTGKHSNDKQFNSIKTAVAEYKDLYPNALITHAQTVIDQMSSVGEVDYIDVGDMTDAEIEAFIDKQGGWYNWGQIQKIRLFFELDKMRIKLSNSKRLSRDDMNTVRSLSNSMHAILKEVVPAKEDDSEKSLLTPKQEAALANATLYFERFNKEFTVAEPSRLIQDAYSPSERSKQSSQG